MALKFLIIDDSDLDRSMTLSFLIEKGYTDVTVAMTAEEALMIAQNNPPDIVISDVMMPDMTGFELCAKLRAINGFYGKIILMTGSIHGIDSDKAKKAGADRLLAKVPTGAALINAIKEFNI